MQPVLILDNEDAVAEVLQLSSMPIPGVVSFGYVAISLTSSERFALQTHTAMLYDSSDGYVGYIAV